MRTDINGCSVTPSGTEQYEYYWSVNLQSTSCQYDYRTQDGKLFSCIGTTLEFCREKRDAWLKKQQAES